MSDIAIHIENLSKAYQIGLKEELPDTFAGALKTWLGSPAQNLRRLRSLDTLRRNGESEDIIWALRDISFSVRQGEVVGIIGRNGAGKSTLLKILSRITDPTTGRAIIRGRVSTLLEVGTGFHHELTGRENIYMNGTILGMKKREIDRKLTDIIDFSGVSRFLDTPVKRYSSGMKVRLAFAVAAHLEPEILIIDEVLAVGDAEFQKRCLNKMRDVASDGRTVLFVSHNMAALSRLCDRGILLQDGQAQFDGTITSAIGEYLSRMNKHASEDVSYRTDRKGNGKLQFIRADISNPQSQSPATGAPIRFSLVLRVNDRSVLQSGRQIRMALTICDALGRVLFACSPAHLGVCVRPTEDVFTLTCSMSRLQLLPSQYRVNLWCKVDGEYADIIEGACEFSVQSGDFFGTGKLPLNTSKSGNIVVSHEWQVRNGSANGCN